MLPLKGTSFKGSSMFQLKNNSFIKAYVILLKNMIIGNYKSFQYYCLIKSFLCTLLICTITTFINNLVVSAYSSIQKNLKGSQAEITITIPHDYNHEDLLKVLSIIKKNNEVVKTFACGIHNAFLVDEEDETIKPILIILDESISIKNLLSGNKGLFSYDLKEKYNKNEPYTILFSGEYNKNNISCTSEKIYCSHFLSESENTYSNTIYMQPEIFARITEKEPYNYIKIYLKKDTFEALKKIASEISSATSLSALCWFEEYPLLETTMYTQKIISSIIIFLIVLLSLLSSHGLLSLFLQEKYRHLAYACIAGFPINLARLLLINIGGINLFIASLAGTLISHWIATREFTTYLISSLVGQPFEIVVSWDIPIYIIIIHAGLGIFSGLSFWYKKTEITKTCKYITLFER